MEKLIEQSLRHIYRTNTDIIRDTEATISWQARLIGITGARGSGKTTMLLQHIKKTFPEPFERVLYLSMDSLWFSANPLTNLVDYFVKRGGTHLFLDEVHNYPNWSVEIKNLYDSFPELHIVFTGSSLLELNQGKADLSRRALMYHLPGLSFREFIILETGHTFPILSFEQILSDHQSIAAQIVSEIKPFQYFQNYLKYGYYPYFLEGKENYTQRLEATLLMILNYELPQLRAVDSSYIPKLKQLTTIIAQSVPFIPNVSKLSEKIGINRNTFLLYLHYLEEAQVFHLLYRNSQGIKLLQKPEKVFLDNTNLMFLLDAGVPDTGNLRETFLANQIKQVAKLNYPEKGDFLVNDTYTIEVGGKQKTRKQLQGIPDAYIAADSIEYGHGRTIPLWLFGFLY